MKPQSDGTSLGLVYVPTESAARHAVAQCHRHKIGYKRIQVALSSSDNYEYNPQRVK